MPVMIIGIVIKVVIALGLLIVIYKMLGLRIISPNEVGIVEKWWSTKGNVKNGKFIALNDEAGFQPDLLRAGVHIKPGFMYKVHKVPLVTIPQGQLGYVFARDGQPIADGQILGNIVECNKFQDVRVFLENGGQKGSQRAILREGTYAIHLAQFVIFTEEGTYYLPTGNNSEEDEIEKISARLREMEAFRPISINNGQDLIGIVTVADGPSLPNGVFIAPVVGDDPSNKQTYHNNFQDPEAFLKAGGFKGRQYQVISEGTYYINRLFANVELKEKTVIPMGYVGVVNSYFGVKGEDTSGINYSHGELVKEGFRGIWERPLMPGKYTFNAYAGEISAVPTTNFILKWIDCEIGGHRFDENLKEVKLITKDAFEPTLPLSVVVHIDYRKAPLVIQRFGDIKKLVEQTIDPMVSAYFKNIAQKMTFIELIQSRSAIQKEATNEMKSKFNNYNIELEEVLIGTPSPNGDVKIEQILLQLSERQLAKEQIETYQSKMEASEEEKKLNEFQAKARQQAQLTESAINIEIQKNVGKAEAQKALQDAEKAKTLADAEAYKIDKLSQVQAEKEARIGVAKALATKEQVNAYGGPQFQVMQEAISKLADAIKDGGIDIVPKSVVSMSGNNGDSNNLNILQPLLGLILSEKLDANEKNKTSNEENETITKIKNEILAKLGNSVSVETQDREKQEQ
ncbi:TPA: flotillin family protein [Clostridium botulinum]|nr:flotillin family protein [Clostridium botulinum]